jgi:hypothetical protein
MGTMARWVPGRACSCRVKLRQIHLFYPGASTSDQRRIRNNNFKRRRSERCQGADFDPLGRFAHRFVAAVDEEIVSTARKTADPSYYLLGSLNGLDVTWINTSRTVSRTLRFFRGQISAIKIQHRNQHVPMWYHFPSAFSLRKRPGGSM